MIFKCFGEFAWLFFSSIKLYYNLIFITEKIWQKYYSFLFIVACDWKEIIWLLNLYWILIIFLLIKKKKYDKIQQGSSFSIVNENRYLALTSHQKRIRFRMGSFCILIRKWTKKKQLTLIRVFYKSIVRGHKFQTLFFGWN